MNTEWNQSDVHVYILGWRSVADFKGEEAVVVWS